MQLLRPNQPNVNLREECSSEWSPLALMKSREWPAMGFPCAGAFLAKPIESLSNVSGLIVWPNSMVKVLLSLTVLMLACLWGSAADSFPKTDAEDPDAQGWNGAGQYLTNAPSLGIGSEAALAYILFSGP